MHSVKGLIQKMNRRKKNKKTERIVVPIDEQMNDEVDSHANECDMSRAEYIRTLHNTFGQTLVDKSNQQDGFIDHEALNELKSNVRNLILDDDYR